MGLPRLGWIAVGTLLTVACSGREDERPPPYAGGSGAPEPLPEPECEPPPTPDTSDACASETVELFGRKPTIYFVLDTSGSMLDYIPEGGDTKLAAAKAALSTVIEEIGPRTKYGLAAFPGETNPDEIAGCAAGYEIVEVKEGDPLECVNLPPRGPVYDAFVRRLSFLQAGGGTPLSPTLEAISPALLGREDQTAIVLITDGAPNCNDEYRCDIEGCEFNRYGATITVNGAQFVCDDTTNCCSEEETGSPEAHLQCVDEPASVEGLEELSAAGIPTYVIGVLGSRDLDDVMNALAEAGGRPREGERKYFDVESLAELTDAVRAIGLDLTQSCEIELVEPPVYANEFNVYFDGEVLPSDPVDGWTLEDNLVTLHGEACDTMRSGEVEQVHLLSGCLTVVR